MKYIAVKYKYIINYKEKENKYRYEKVRCRNGHLKAKTCQKYYLKVDLEFSLINFVCTKWFGISFNELYYVEIKCIFLKNKCHVQL